jgi:cytochrome c-type biogenesis protein CcmH/NrfG
MTSTNQASSWTAKQVYLMAIISLVIGIAGGFLLHGSAASSSQIEPGLPSSAPMGSPAAAPTSMAPPISKPQPTPAEMQAASAQAATPVLEQLKADPKNFKLLVGAGEMYYHHGAYAEANVYYKRALDVQNNVPVRNQYASALYYLGDADGALKEYAQVLKESPSNDVALFNSGMVKYESKHDAKGAVELWERLLKTNPNHPQRERVLQMIEKASQQKD